MKPKLIRITTVPGSLRSLLKGQLKYMTANGYEVIGVASSGSALNEVRQNEGVATVAIEMTRVISPLKDLQALIKLIQLLRKERPQIVHTHTPKAGLLGMIAAKITGIPLRLHTVAGMPLTVATGSKRKMLNIIEKLTYSCATMVYPNSYGLEKLILEQKFTTPSKLKVIGNGSSNGIDTAYFDPNLITDKEKLELKEKLSISENDFVYIFVGRLVGDKGINDLVKAFVNINNQNTKLLLVGPMELSLDPLQHKTLDDIKNNPKIISVGFQKDVRPYFAISNALVFPSYREGFPNVVMQAGAMELPSIVSNINGCNEIIKEGINGTIIPVKDTKLFQKAMLKILEDKNYYNELKANSRQLICNQYEQHMVWEEILKEYNNLVGINKK